MHQIVVRYQLYRSYSVTYSSIVDAVMIVKRIVNAGELTKTDIQISVRLLKVSSLESDQ